MKAIRGRGARLVLVAAAVLVGSAGVSLATTRAVADGVIKACYATKSGQLRVLTGAAPSCAGEEAAIAWNQKGVFSGSFSSPDGRFTISVTDAGIKLKGPSGHVKVAAAMIELTNAGTLVRLTPAAVQATGPQVKLNGCARPVARQNDAIAGSGAVGPDGGGFAVNGTVVAGSTTVCAG